MSDVQAERSKLLNRQKSEMQELVKKGKKLKGAMKDANQTAIDELEKKQEAELKEFDGTSAKGGGGYAGKEAPPADKPSSSSVAKADFGKARNWGAYSKKELEEFCSERSISKKGNKEELVMRLTLFHQDLETNKVQAGGDEDAEASSAAADPPKKSGSKGAAKAAVESDDEGSDEEGSDESSDEEMPEVSLEEAERQAKREKAVRGAIKVLMTKKPDGFPLDELPALLASINVANFTPQKLGYPSLRAFAKGQPGRLFAFDRKTNYVKQA
eukprot:TRINITY_DN70332_c0_g1_i1.p1 TRINITY_DN70332_c0_g1~~TRINITY_DN70332_c0_g1_i1.p1  ORF type:complete len:271 (+),score=80.74 TRINITY_DN70332_c0_g1_i1:87-899(+)